MLTLIPVMFLMFAPQAMVLHRAPVEYPRAAMSKNVQGTVLVEVNIDQDGLVIDAHVVSGPAELRNAALQSVLNWHFSKQMGLPAVTQVPVEFALPPNGPAKPILAARRPATTKVDKETIRQIAIDGLSEPARDTLLNRLPVREGDELNSELFQRVATEVDSYDEHLRVTLIHRPDGVTIDIAPRGPQGSFRFGDYSAPIASKQIRVGGSAQQMKLVQQVRPAYPPQAKAAGIQGIVKLEAVIGTDGHVRNLKVLSGEPELVPMAMEATRQWVYEPTRLNGEPVEVITQIDVNFVLSK